MHIFTFVLCLMLNTVNAQDQVSDPFANLNLGDIDIEKSESKKNYQFSGFFSLDTAYSPQRKDEVRFSKGRLSSLLQFDAEFNESLSGHMSLSSFYDFSYQYNDDINFDALTLDEYESQLDVYELYFNHQINPNIRLKIGRQIIVWGNSEVDRIIDIVTPLDLREIGTKDIGDQRLPVAAIRFIGYFDPWQIEFNVLPEIRPDRLPTQDSGFDVFSSLRATSILLPEEKPSSGLGNTELALNIKRFFHSADLSFIVASVFDDQPFFDFVDLDDQQLVFRPRYNELLVTGFSFAYSKGPFLWKTEGVHIKNKALARDDLFAQIQNGQEVQSWQEKSISRYMLGLEYSGFKNLFTSIEYIGQRVHDHDDQLFVPVESHSFGTVLRHNALRNKLTTTLTGIYDFEEGGGWFLRLGLEYELSHHMSLSGLYTHFKTSDQNNMVFPLRNSDRFDFRLIYQF